MIESNSSTGCTGRRIKDAEGDLEWHEISAGGASGFAQDDPITRDALAFASAGNLPGFALSRAGLYTGIPVAGMAGPVQ